MFLFARLVGGRRRLFRSDATRAIGERESSARARGRFVRSPSLQLQGFGGRECRIQIAPRPAGRRAGSDAGERHKKASGRGLRLSCSSTLARPTASARATRSIRTESFLSARSSRPIRIPQRSSCILRLAPRMTFSSEPIMFRPKPWGRAAGPFPRRCRVMPAWPSATRSSLPPSHRLLSAQFPPSSPTLHSRSPGSFSTRPSIRTNRVSSSSRNPPRAPPEADSSALLRLRPRPRNIKT